MILQVPDALATQSECSAQELVFGMAVGLLLQGRLTLGQAGSALGLSKPELMEAMHKSGLPMPYDRNDAEADLQAIHRLWPEGNGAPRSQS